MDKTALLKKVVPFLMDKVVASLIGTIAGAFIAFKVKEIQDQRAEDRRRQASGNYALFVLVQQITDLLNTERAIAEWRPEDQRPTRWAGMKVLLTFGELLPHRAEDLGWLLEGEHRNVLSKYLAARNHYATTLGAIEHRNKIKERFDDFLEREIEKEVHKFPDGLIPHKLLKEKASQRQKAELEQSAEDVLEATALAFHITYLVADELHAAMKCYWPDEVFVKPEPKEEFLRRFGLSLPEPDLNPATPPHQPMVHRIDVGGLATSDMFHLTVIIRYQQGDPHTEADGSGWVM